MLKQTIVCLLSCGLLLSSTQAISRAPYSQSVSNHCQMTQGLFSLGTQCIKKNSATRQGIITQINYLKKTWQPKRKKIALTNATISRYQLVSSVRTLLQWYDSDTNLAEHFELHELQGDSGNAVDMTGYYTPILSASRTPNHRYKHPIYKTPTDYRRFLSHAEIAAGQLAHSGLEIAWVEDPIDLFYVHVQGSAVLQFPNGERRIVRYAASNEKPFSKISRYMQQRGYLTRDLSRRAITQWLRQNPTHLNEVLTSNSRYVFFTEDSRLSTASGTGLIPGHSVAVDTRHIPFGSVLLAEIPVSNTYNGTATYEWRLLFPQDRGIAIKGGARLDLYTGKGEIARKIANNVTGARRVYLLLSKQNQGQT